MGFEPTTTCLGSKDSTTELRPLAESNPTLGLYAKSRNSWQLPPQFNKRKLSSANIQAIGPAGYKCQDCVCVGLSCSSTSNAPDSH